MIVGTKTPIVLENRIERCTTAGHAVVARTLHAIRPNPRKRG